MRPRLNSLLLILASLFLPLLAGRGYAAASAPSLRWQGRELWQGPRRLWQAPHTILKAVPINYASAASPRVVVLTAERPLAPQPRRSHLYLLNPATGTSRLLSPEPDYNFWDLTVGDVDGDGVPEVGLCTYSSTARVATVARRYFVYGWTAAGDLHPLWRGSRLCRPYVSAALFDATGDRKAELISVERALSGKFVVVSYQWNQFGFWGLGHSAEYDSIQTVAPSRSPAGAKCVRVTGRRGGSLVADLLTISDGQLRPLASSGK